MLQTIEIITTRAHVRRKVDTRCEIVADLWDVPIEHEIRDLSEQGMWVECLYPLEVGDEIVVALHPPGEGEPVHALGRVRRVHLGRRKSDPQGAGMGVEFLHVEERSQGRLSKALQGIPPRLERTTRSRFELVWVDDEVDAEG